MGKKNREPHVSKRMQQFLDGKITVEDLDDEEIRRGQFRDKNGNFQGRPHNNLPLKWYKAIAQENIRRQDRRWQELYGPAIDTLKEISNNKRLPADARMKSAVYIVERAAGKVPEKQEMHISVAKWEEDIEELFTYNGEASDATKGQGEGTTEG